MVEVDRKSFLFTYIDCIAIKREKYTNNMKVPTYLSSQYVPEWTHKVADINFAIPTNVSPYKSLSVSLHLALMITFKDMHLSFNAVPKFKLVISSDAQPMKQWSIPTLEENCLYWSY